VGLGLGLGCSAPQYGALPAKCTADDACPGGYACVRGVCAEPGTPVPSTVTRRGYLRGFDLKMVAEDNSALVLWATYPYSEEGQRFVGVRVFDDGSVSPEIELVSTFEASENTVEPFYDVLRTAPDRLLLAVSASPLDDDESPSPRLITYRVTLPPPGLEAEASTAAEGWPQEERLSTIGYGGVSQPKLVARGDHVELGYFQTRVAPAEESQPAQTIGELAVFRLDAGGDRLGGECDPACCPADLCYRARDGLTVAVNVSDAFSLPDRTWWVLDDVRPSALLVPDADPAGALDVPLAALSIPVGAQDGSLTYLEASARADQKLPTDPVDGPARLHRLEVLGPPAGGALGPTLAVKQLGEDWPGFRDSPRPVWLVRPGREALLITPGVDLDSPDFEVRAVDVASGAQRVAQVVPRFGSAPVVGLQAALAGGKLYIAWVDSIDDVWAIRVVVLPEP
jgi:hypothetical protein